MMHLDTVMTMVDKDTFVLCPYIDRNMRSWTVSPGRHKPLLAAIALALAFAAMVVYLPALLIRLRHPKEIA
jgi:arginine deiminase